MVKFTKVNHAQMKKAFIKQGWIKKPKPRPKRRPRPEVDPKHELKQINIPFEFVDAEMNRGRLECSLKPEVMCPTVGWRQPVRLCGNPDQLLKSLEGKKVGDEIFCTGSFGEKATNSKTKKEEYLHDQIECWKIVELKSPPNETILEFISWGKLKPPPNPQNSALQSPKS